MTHDQFQKMSWSFQDNRQYADRRYYLIDMRRDQVREALQWCLQNDDTGVSTVGDYRIGGYNIREWIVAFTLRLFDPECE